VLREFRDDLHEVAAALHQDADARLRIGGKSIAHDRPPLRLVQPVAT
jgi:hypothetical protein